MNLTVKMNDPNSLGAVVMNGSVAIAVCRPVQFITKGDDGVLVPYQVTVEDALAYAHLFAAAPDLLAALKDLDECYCEAGNDLSREDRNRHRLVLIAARAAIAKATGAA